MKPFFKDYFEEVIKTTQSLPLSNLEDLIDELVLLRENKGRLFFLGVGGSAANCSHAVNDFRKLCGIEAYTPIDNISEITARTNDEGWDTVFSNWLITSQAKKEDALFILSVGGGNKEQNISANLTYAIDEAKKRDMKIFGIVGKEEGYTQEKGDIVIRISTHPSYLTPLAESFQTVIWHALVSHPKLQQNSAKWESSLSLTL